MKRRDFIKTLGIAGAALMVPPVFLRHLAGAALPTGISYSAPAVMPKVINIFLYGGPSELAGNLTNIAEINANSQNKYPSYLDPAYTDPVITKNYFWGPDSNGNYSAGGDSMEQLIASGDLSVYRTINRIKDDNKGHGMSVHQNLVGNLDITGAGIATTLAAVLAANNAFGKPLDQLVLPVVSFEGESHVFDPGGLDIPLMLQPVTLDQNFRNPYSRSNNSYLNSAADVSLETLARQVSAMLGTSHQKLNDAFVRRAELDQFITNNLDSATVNASLPIDPVTTLPIVYPDTDFGDRLKAAVSLAINNPDTYFISLGSGGLGGWDDHSSTLANYPARMKGLMAALKVAVTHMNLKNANNIVINVFGDFGRNVNLNNAGGWDHGNNQNFFTLGGKGIPGRTLGKLVGRTSRIGTSLENRQFTSPTSGSYQCEPFAIASTIFRYFGVQNPEILTGEPAIDEVNPPNEFMP
jgi:hypothetical protein